MKQFVITLTMLLALTAHATPIQLKNLVRIEGIRENALTGYGIVVGLAGTGDTRRSQATVHSIANALLRFGIRVSDSDISSRNVAAVMVTTKLPAFANKGDKLDVNISSIGDSRSLVGGTLLLAPLRGADGKIYGLAQGPVSVGGFKYDLYGNVIQKNHPTVASIPDGLTVEKAIANNVVNHNGEITLLLKEPDFTTAARIKQKLRKQLKGVQVRAVNPGKIVISQNNQYDYVDLIATIERLTIIPDNVAKIIVNERTGTVVSGSDVVIDSVTVSHGNIELSITTDYITSQPNINIQANINSSSGINTTVVPDTQIEVKEDVVTAISMPSGTTVGNLVSALRKIRVSTRDLISILQTIKSSGALHAELIIK
ncbi:flagellar basal body P-ring protein FlgI [Zooshikella harenae]|uniref:Flagellar P-ring protein n=1 Tax=Zooshikella harenae TaxID=2827238 RepID=A0ABS5ZCF8_9GAMM|nr:flagellar basal body P-ring protein FlgI [Zooshikella harenae]MBU2711655.1 flagellar basal body P-ring protein FlgI [Zooshikella harenae]